MVISNLSNERNGTVYSNTNTNFNKRSYDPDGPYSMASKESLFKELEKASLTAPSVDELFSNATAMDYYAKNSKEVLSKFTSGMTSNNPIRVGAFDFETMFVKDSNNIGRGLVTELGYAENIIKGSNGKSLSSLNKITKQGSIALGIGNEDTFIDLAKEVDVYFNKRNSIARKDLGSYASDMDRLAAYSGNLTDVFRMQTHNVDELKGLGSILSVRELNNYGTLTKDAAVSGLVNQGIVGGLNEKQMKTALDSLGLYSNDLDIAGKIATFNSNGFTAQSFDNQAGQDIVNAYKRYIKSYENDGVLMGYNTIKYDIPIFNQIGDTSITLNPNKQLDLYTAQLINDRTLEGFDEMFIASNDKRIGNVKEKLRESGVAEALGITLNAHNAGNDTAALLQIATDPRFFDTVLKDQISERKQMSINPFGDNVLGRARKSMYYNIDSNDVLVKNGNVASAWSEYGVNRGRYYKLDGIVQKDDKYMLKMSAAGENADEVFYKTFNSQEELFGSLDRFFEFQTDVTKEQIAKAEETWISDVARRQYDRFFQISEIGLDKEKVTNGWDKLNTYYDAYKTINGDFVGLTSTDLLNTTKYDDAIKQVLAETDLGYTAKDGMTKTVAPTEVRNFKALYDKIASEGEFIEKVNESFNNLGLTGDDLSSVIKKTGIAKELRDMYVSDNIPLKTIVGDNDLFGIHLTGKTKSNIMLDGIVDFSNVSNASQSILNLAERTVKAANVGNVDFNTRDILFNIARDLKSQGYISKKMWQGIKSTYNGGAQKNIYYAQQIARAVDRSYIQPIRDLVDTDGKQWWDKNHLQALIDWRSGMPSTVTAQDITDFANANNLAVDNVNALSRLLRLSYDKMKDTDYTGNMIYKAKASIVDDLSDLESEASKISKKYGNLLSVDSEATKEQIHDILTKQMGYNEREADAVRRLLYNPGIDKPGGFMSSKYNGISNGKLKLTDYVTTFFKPDEEGSNAFILINHREDTGGRNVLQELLSSKDYKTGIEKIKEKGGAFVITLPNVHTDKRFFGDDNFNLARTDVEGNLVQREMRYITQGDSIKIMREKIAYNPKSFSGTYEERKRYGIDQNELVMKTDLEEIVDGYIMQRGKLENILQNKNLTFSERYRASTSKANRTMNAALSESKIPGISGITSLLDKDGVWRKVPVLNDADIARAAQVNYQDLQKLFLDSITKNKDIEMANLVATFSNNAGIENSLDIVRNMSINFGDEAHGFTTEFNEFFLKSLFNMPLNYGAGREYEEYMANIVNPEKYFGDGKDYTLINYMLKATEGEEGYGLLKALQTDFDAGRIWMGGKPADVQKFYMNVAGVPWLFNTNALLNLQIGPKGAQQNGARPYIAKDFVNEIEGGMGALKRIGIDVTDNFQYLEAFNIKQARKNIPIPGFEEWNFGDFETKLNMRFRHLSLDDAQKIVNNFDFMALKNDANLAKKMAEYGVQNVDTSMLEAAFEALKMSDVGNIWDSFFVLNPALAKTSYFTTPNIRTAKFNGYIEDYDEALKIAKDFIANNSNHMVTNSTKFNTEAFSLQTGLRTGEKLKYIGPEGMLQFKDEEELAQILMGNKRAGVYGEQRIPDVKGMAGYEKGLFRVYEKEHPIYEQFFGKYSSDADARFNEANKYLTFVFEQMFGNVAGIGYFPIAKHAGSKEEFFLNAILQALNNDEYDINGKKGGYSYASRKALRDALNGLKVDAPKLVLQEVTRTDVNGNQYQGFLQRVGDAANDPRGLQIRISAMKDFITKYVEANKDNIDEKHRIYKDLYDTFNDTKTLGYIWQAFGTTPNEETKGEEMSLNDRLETAIRSQMALYDEIVEYADDNKNFTHINGKAIDDIIINALIDDNTKTQAYNNAKQSIEGIWTSLLNITNPDSEELIGRNDIIEMNIKDIVSAPKGANKFATADIEHNSIFRLYEAKYNERSHTLEESTRTSDFIKQLAKEQGTHESEVRAFRLHFDRPYTFDGKQYTSTIMPLLDRDISSDTSFSNKLGNSIEAVISAAKNFDDSNDEAIKRSQRYFDSAMKTYIEELQYAYKTANKDSYITERFVKKGLHNYKQFGSTGVLSPVVGDMINSSAWQEDLAYRDTLIKAVKEGDVSRNIKYASELSNGIKNGHVVEGKYQYDLVSTVGVKGFEDLGLNFEKTGADIAKNFQKYEDTVVKMYGAENLSVLDNVKKRVAEYEKIAKAASKQDLAAAQRLIAETYLTDVGMYGITARYPAIKAAPISIIKLDKTLGRDEVRMDAVLAALINDDSDGDNPMIGLFLKKGKIALEDTDLFKALNKAYTDFTTGANGKHKSINELFAKQLQKASDKITAFGGFADTIDDGYVGKVVKMDTILTKKQKEQYLEALRTDQEIMNDIAMAPYGQKLGALVERLKDPEDLDILFAPGDANNGIRPDRKLAEHYETHVQKVIDFLFKEMVNDQGNPLKAPVSMAAALKSHITGSNIGFISNPNYHLNQAMIDIQRDLLAKGDKEATVKLNSIMQELYNLEGSLVIVEQTAIDVKKNWQGLSISKAKSYNDAVKNLFSVNSKNKDMSDLSAMENMFKALSQVSDMELEEFRSATELAKAVTEFRATRDAETAVGVKLIASLMDLRDMFISDPKYKAYHEMLGGALTKSVAETREGIQKFVNTVSDISANGEYGNAVTAAGKGYAIYQQLAEEEYLSKKFYTPDGVVHPVNEAMVYFKSDSQGYEEPTAYKLNGKKTGKNKNGSFNMVFETMDGKELKYTGTADEVQSWLQDTFGQYTPMDIKRYDYIQNNPHSREVQMQMSNHFIGDNIAKFLNENANRSLSGQQLLSVDEFMGTLRSSKDSLIFERLKGRIASIEVPDYQQLAKELSYINEKTQNGQSIFNQINEINHSIVNTSKGKKTSTKDIIKSYYEMLTEGKSSILEDIYQNIGDFTDYEYDPLSLDNLSKLFAKTDADRVNTSVAMNEANVLIPKSMRDEDLEEQIKKIKEKYDKKNNTALNEYNLIKNKIASTEQMDALFGWNQQNLENMRVGIGSDEFMGRRFGDLSEVQIKSILKIEPEGNAYDRYAAQQTKKYLSKYVENIGNRTVKGLMDEDSSMLTANRQAMINGQVNRAEASKINRAAREQARAEGISNALNKAGLNTNSESIAGDIDKVLNFMGEHKKIIGGTVGALLALGVLDSIMSKNDSPLSPGRSAMHGEHVGKSGFGTDGAPFSIERDSSPIYTAPYDDLNYHMSATSVKRLNHGQVVDRMGIQGNTEVSVNDNTRQISDEWMEETMSHYI